MQFRTRAIHKGSKADPATGAVIPPLHLSATFVQPGSGDWGEFDYSRSGNPTRKAFETALADLEGGCGALAFASGMAATHCAMTLLASGGQVIAGSDIYGGTYRLLHNVLDRYGIQITLVPSQDFAALEAALKNAPLPPTPRADKRGGSIAQPLVWIESPGNPLLSITDIGAVAELAHRYGALVAVDNTFATPALTRPLEMGADIVMHSATKYIGGHSDVLGGALAVRDTALLDRLYYIQNATGPVMGPWESFLCTRGLKTLELRVREQSRTAAKIAEYLAGEKRVAKVYYPGLASHPGHAIAQRQMDGAFGAMLSFEIHGDFAAAKKLAESTRLFQLAVSLGAVESLIEQPAAMSHASYAAADRQRFGITDTLVRLSVGLEAFEDLRDDLDQALAAAVA